MFRPTCRQSKRLPLLAAVDSDLAQGTSRVRHPLGISFSPRHPHALCPLLGKSWGRNAGNRDPDALLLFPFPRRVPQPHPRLEQEAHGAQGPQLRPLRRLQEGAGRCAEGRRQRRPRLRQRRHRRHYVPQGRGAGCWLAGWSRNTTGQPQLFIISNPTGALSWVAPVRFGENEHMRLSHRVQAPPCQPASSATPLRYVVPTVASLP